MTRAMPNVKAYVSVNKAVVTQASAAIPIVPLYISILYKVMKDKGLHEGCSEQMYRLFKEKLFAAGGAVVDEAGYLRVDDWEMRPDVQQEVDRIWPIVTTENAADYCDIAGYWDDFSRCSASASPGSTTRLTSKSTCRSRAFRSWTNPQAKERG